MIAIEQLSEQELRVLHERFIRLAEVSQGGAVTSVATVDAGALAALNGDESVLAATRVARASQAAPAA